MKVSTDACIFGAFVAQYLQSGKPAVNNLLDIGTGTGLLSLMIAQQTTLKIDAVEIDPETASQASQNFSQSPWKDRINLYQQDIRSFAPARKYDAVISNPPFYEDDLKPVNQKNAVARHSSLLGFEELLKSFDLCLQPGGFFAVLLPWQRGDSFIASAKEKDYHLYEQLTVRHSGKHAFSRTIFILGKQQQLVKSAELDIRDAGGNYTQAFTALMKPYCYFL